MREGELPKEEVKPSREGRLEKILPSGVFERKRFLLSRNPEIKERLEKLQEVIYDLKKQYPEIIAFGLTGSLVKGYAVKESDIDGFLFVNL